MDKKVELRIETVIYVTRQTSDGKEVLLIHRDKAPNIGRSLPLGETVRSDESPYECTVRSLQNAGITAKEITYKGLVTEVSPTIQWHLFLYEITKFEGAVLDRIEEGKLQWVNVTKLETIDLPQADKIMTPEILIKNPDFYEAKMYFNDENILYKTDVYQD